MSRLAERIRNIPNLKLYAIGRAAQQWQAKNPGKPFTSFLVGDTLFRHPQYITKAVVRSIRQQLHKYGNVAGEPPVLEAVTKDFERLGITGLDPQKNLCITHGTLEAFTLAALAVLSPNYEALVPVPHYFFYPHNAWIAGGTPRFIRTSPENRFKLTPELLENNITGLTSILYLNSPRNPDGFMYSREDLLALARVLKKHPYIYVFCDEIYERMVLDREHISLWAVAPELRDRILIFNHMSKPFGLSGLRVGWVAGPEDVLAAIIKLKGPLSYNTNTLGQAALLAALSNQEECLAEIVLLQGRLRAGRKLMLDRLDSMGIKLSGASGGMFVFPKIPESLAIPKMDLPGWDEMTRGEKFAYWLIQFGTTVSPGIDYGPYVPEYFRLLYGMNRRSIDQGLNSLERALKSA